MRTTRRELLQRWFRLATAMVCLAAPGAWAAEKASEKVSPFYGSFSQGVAFEVPGYRGLEPKLALGYSSEGRNGFVGVGWSLSGVSTIERTNAAGGTPRFDVFDAYRLDGQELVACQGGSVSPSCTSGGTHSTKIESYLKIRFDSGSNSWTVWGRDGTRTVFTPVLNVPLGSYVPGGTLRWGQTSAIDTDNNTVSSTWSCVDGDCYPNTISYNGYQVTLYREVRPDVLTFAAASLLGQTRYRLLSVVVSLGATPIRGYKLVYLPSPATGRSLLASVQQFGKDLVNSSGQISGPTSLPAQTFTYQNDALAKSFQDWGTAPSPPGGSDAVTWGEQVNVLADANNLTKNAGGNGAWNAGATSTRALASGNGYLQFTASQSGASNAYKIVGLSNGNTDASDTDIDFGLWEYPGGLVYVLENGTQFGPYPRADGDLLRVEVLNGQVLYKRNGNTFRTSLKVPTYPLRVDASIRNVGSTIQNANLSGALVYVNGWCQGSTFLSGDFNGDGRTDQLCQDMVGANSRLQVALATSTGFSAPATWLLTSAGLARLAAADFNADGKADVVNYTNATGDVHVALSTGTGFGTLTSWGNAYAVGPSGPRQCRIDPAFFGTGDFNGDGATDVYCKLMTSPAILVGINNGSAPFAFSVFGEYACDTFDHTVGAIDFDGDAKDDWYCIGEYNNWLLVLTSSGSEFLYPSYGALNMCDWAHYALGDLNGDGRTDVSCLLDGKVALSMGRDWAIQTPASGGWCNLGTGYFATDVDGDGASELVCNNVGAGASDIQVRKWANGALTPAATWKANWCSGKASTGDFNGDGRPDLYCDSTGTAAVSGTGGFQSDLMSVAANGLGGTTQVAYTTSTSFINTNNPPPKYVVSSVTAGDGRGGSSTSTYTYSNGFMHRKERRFLGFAYARTTLPCLVGESTCPYVETFFEQGLASAGKPYKVQQKDGSGSLLARSDFTYVTNDTTIPLTSILTSQKEYSYPGTGCPSPPCTQEKQTQVTHQYDAYGNRTRTDFLGDLSAIDDGTYTVWTFRPNTSAYIVDRPAVSEQFEPTGVKLTSKQLYYDGQNTWDLPPVKGHVTKERNWLNLTSGYVSRPFTYDTYGNLTQVKDETNRPVTTTYDLTYHIFPVTVTNGAGEMEQMTWDPVCGQVYQHRDANNQLTTTQFDALCRPTRTDGPQGAFEIRRYLNFGNPSQQRIKIETPSAVGPEPDTQWSEAYFDGLGRPYLSMAEHPGSSSGVRRDTAYNARGGVANVSAPYFPGSPMYATHYTYDALDRVTEVAHPDSHRVGKSYGLWSETTTDENGRWSTVHFDAYGRPTISERPHDGNVLQTTSTYDLLGRLVHLLDPIKIEWGWSFDSLGRNYSKTDPDLGTWTYTFDDAGRVLTQTDAKSQQTTFSYDLAGRLASKTTGGPNQPTETVTITRSEPGTVFCNIGRVTTVAGPGTTILKSNYDCLGRAVSEERWLDGVPYQLQRRYDSAGRLLGLTYPDGDAVGPQLDPLRYDAAGRLKVIPGIISNVVYDAAGRPTVQTNANGTVTTRTYSADRGFLTGISTPGIQGLTYDLDPTGRADAVTSNDPSESWNYGYDDLYRLISAADGTEMGGQGGQTFEYDDIGRMTYNSRVGKYAYPAVGSPRPHAPFAVGGGQYNYDLNGNLEAGGGRTFTWTVDNLPRQINQTSFTYGAFGERLKKVTPQGGPISLYPLGDDYEITNGVLTKYINVEGLGAVAKKTAGQVYWHHTDRLGSIQAVTRNDGTVAFRRTYRPYGEKITESGSHIESKGYIGERTDGETGLTYLHARYYDPALGIFLSPDPIGADLTSYRYAGDNPTNLKDSTGLGWSCFPVPVGPPVCIWLSEDVTVVSDRLQGSYVSQTIRDHIFEQMRRAQEEASRHRPPIETPNGPTGGAGTQPPPTEPPCTENCDPPGEPPGSGDPANQRRRAGPASSRAPVEGIRPSDGFEYEEGLADCVQTFGERWRENFSMTNRTIPGLMAPLGLGLVTGGIVGRAIGHPTLFGGISLYVSGSENSMAGTIAAGRAVSLARGLVTTGVHFVVVGTAAEVGISIGSAYEAGYYRGTCR